VDGLCLVLLSISVFFAFMHAVRRTYILMSMVLRCLSIIGLAVLFAHGSDVPPESLIRENLKKASVIVEGTIESAEAPQPGLTVARFRVSICYRGHFNPGDEIFYASFKEGDHYSSEFLQKNLIVFLRKRSRHYTPPAWETATDLSEFLYPHELEAKIPNYSRRTQR
jgi:hypothetical protein